MPLNTQIRRDGEALRMPHGWGGFHVAAMVIAAAIDSGEGPWEDNSKAGIFPDDPEWPITLGRDAAFQLTSYPSIGATPLNNGEYTLTGGPYTFVDATDGEVLELREGDTLIAYRN